jgi:hypothetical protein
MPRKMQKWIAILALALMPAVVYASACATSYDLAKLSSIQSTTNDASTPCENGKCSHANLCDLAQVVFVGYSLNLVQAQHCSGRAVEVLKVSIPAEPRPPLKPPVV